MKSLLLHVKLFNITLKSNEESFRSKTGQMNISFEFVISLLVRTLSLSLIRQIAYLNQIPKKGILSPTEKI